jgi:hypothetical protein
MKKIFRNSRVIAIAFFTVFTAAMAPAAMAHSSKDVPVELKYVGNINNHTIFQLIVNSSTTHNDYTIIIRDPFGNSVYRENIKADNFSKKFLFDTDELGDDTLEFEIYNRKTDQSVRYMISRQTRSSEEMVASTVK